MTRFWRLERTYSWGFPLQLMRLDVCSYDLSPITACRAELYPRHIWQPDRMSVLPIQIHVIWDWLSVDQPSCIYYTCMYPQLTRKLKDITVDRELIGNVRKYS